MSKENEKTEKSFSDEDVVTAYRGSKPYEMIVFYTDQILEKINEFGLSIPVAQDVVMATLIAVVVQHIEHGLPENKSYSTPAEYVALINHCIKESVLKSIEMSQQKNN